MIKCYDWNIQKQHQHNLRNDNTMRTPQYHCQMNYFLDKKFTLNGLRNMKYFKKLSTVFTTNLESVLVEWIFEARFRKMSMLFVSNSAICSNYKIYKVVLDRWAGGTLSTAVGGTSID